MLYLAIKTAQGAVIAVAVPNDALLSKTADALSARYIEPRLHSFITEAGYMSSANRLVLTEQETV